MIMYTLTTSDKKETVLVLAEDIKSAQKSLKSYEEKKMIGEILEKVALNTADRFRELI